MIKIWGFIKIIKYISLIKIIIHNYNLINKNLLKKVLLTIYFLRNILLSMFCLRRLLLILIILK